LELVHCHIARQPIPLQELNPVIPDAIAAIVMKLLAKNAEDRYHSGLGLKADLETCLTQWQNQGAIPHFIPGQLDRSGKLLIPQKLYAREAEIQQLMAAFDRISQGKSEIVLVSGFSGIGKSSLVNEVHKPIVRQRGYFISGKFDQFKRNIPYSALAQAFSELIRQLLTESQVKIASWKEQILQAVGNNGQIIIDIIPEVELIIGTQPAVPTLGTTESQNRFNQVFQEFVRTFTKASHPLVLFVDDLQWSDPASLQLIKFLITDSNSYYLLFLGAYRDNEVNDAHPLIQALEAVKQAGVVINNIVLPPFQLNHVQELIGDTLNKAENYQGLAALLFQQTQGNAFFLTQLLKTLHQEQFLKYNFEQNQWQWEITQIESVGIADINVVELVAGNIQKLPLATQKVLKLAACIGDRFNLEVLAIVNETSLSETSEALWIALQVGLILPLSNEYKIPLSFTQQEMEFFKIDRSRIIYKFLHDRVQQAAYSLIPEEQKKVTHLKIGQLLLEKTSENDLAENIFDIVNQLNIGANLIIYKSEKVEERTQELQYKNQELSETLSVLQRTQSQLIQSEKMSGLGQLVGGVAHEINNPVTFIAGNLDYTNESIQKILHLIEQYNYYYPNPVPEIAEEIQEIELENLIEDLPNSFNSMKKGAERIKSIVLSLRDFAQKDKSEINLVNIHTGIESTLLILQYELSAKPDLPEIAVIKNYGDLPRVECYVAKLNQVMINILNNAIYAVRKRKLQEIGNENYRPTIWIATELIDSDRITIRITDNGIGISESDLPRIFDPFFTTKPVGSGTGLGLSISYQIIVETHGGELKCSSELGKGTEMAIAIPIQQSS